MQERNWNKWKPRIFFKLNDNLWKGVLRVSHSSEKVFTLPPSPCYFIGFVTTQRVLWMPWTNKLFSHFFLTILTLLPILLCNRLLFCIFIYTCLFFLPLLPAVDSFAPYLYFFHFSFSLSFLLPHILFHLLLLFLLLFFHLIINIRRTLRTRCTRRKIIFYL